MEQTRTSGALRPSALDAAANNTDLWISYLQGQVRSWIDPFGIGQPETMDAIARPLADMAAAAMSGWMSLVAGAPVRMMYNGNKADVSRFVNERAIDPESIEIPAEYIVTARRPAPATTQLEEWAVTAERERELVLA